MIICLKNSLMNIQCKFDITDTRRTLKPEREEMEAK
jgi:hypothetical protein